MKHLNSVQEVWARCMFCPLCQDVVRDVDVIVGPSEMAELVSFKKNGPILEVKCKIPLGSKKNVHTYYIDCPRNTFTFSVVEVGIQEAPNNRVAGGYFFLTFMSSCPQCNCTYTNSLDMELDFLQKKISNLGISLEGIYLLKDKSKFHLTFQHENDTILVSKMTEDTNGELVDDNKTVSFPMTHFDFSKPKKVLNRLKTLLVFS
jgi:hypothetical protein